MSGNKKSVDIYIKYVTEQISHHKLQEHIQDIIDNLQPNFLNLSIHQTNTKTSLFMKGHSPSTLVLAT